ncbi:MAG: hypothetical protein CL610_14870 [Anaerolineaceae bacterium]|nr:hypothetical protein [Anaerolineaceae bacterium]
MNNINFDALYPDVLGAITGGTRISIDQLQVALGIFPQRTYINQPVELVLILQNMVDQPMQVKVGIQTPTEDKKGRPVVMDLPKKTITLGLRAGEVGVLRIPVVPRPPTQAGNHFPVRVAVRYRTPKPGRRVRPFSGGPPPSILSISSFKLQVLRDVPFSAETWHHSTDVLTTYFDIAPRVMPDIGGDLKPRYESLWTHEELAGTRQKALARVEDARRVSTGLTRTNIYLPLRETIEERFAARGLPLHPGEAMAIAKMVTYTLDEGLELEQGFSVEDSQWFKTLCQVLAYDENLEDLNKGQLATQYLFEAALFDAIMLGFGVIEPRVNEDLGDTTERVQYANRVLSWMAGQGEPDLSYAYLPLIMGAILVNELANVKPENPWTMLELLREALRGRARLFTGEKVTIFNMTADLLELGEEMLRRARIPRA